MNLLFSLPVALGIVAAFVSPYYALELNQHTIYILSGMTFLVYLKNNFSLSLDFKKNVTKYFYCLFLSGCLMPAIMWLICSAILSSTSLKIGFFWATLAPTALFVPTLLKENQNGRQRASEFMTLSIFGMALIAPVMSYVFWGNSIDLNLKSYCMDMLVAAVGPVTLTAIINKTALVKKLNKLLSPFLVATCTFVLVGVLSYIFLGTAFLKLNLATISGKDLIVTAILSIGFNFIIYFFTYLLTPRASQEKINHWQLIAVSTKNIALMGGILIFYRPQSVLPIAGIFISHAIFIFCYNHLVQWEAQRFIKKTI